MKKIIILLLIIGCICYFMRDKTTVKNVNNPASSIVAFGDSLTAGYGAPKGSSYPDFLARRLGQEVINLGLSGETAVHAPARLPEVLAQNPYMVLIEFGANDYMQGRSMQNAVEAVRQIVDSVQQAGAVAVIVDTGGPGMGEYSNAYKKLARDKEAVFVPAILKGIFNKKQYKSDMVHPNADGYEIIADRIYEAIKPYLKK